MTSVQALSQLVSRIVGREVSARQLRPMLRLLFPKASAAKDGGRWSLKARQVRLVTDIFWLIRTYEEADRVKRGE